MDVLPVRTTPLAVALSLISSTAVSQVDTPDPERPCQDFDVYIYPEFDVSGGGGDPLGRGAAFEVADLAETVVGAAGDFICKVFPCGGSGGDDGGTGDPGPGEGETDGTPEGEPGGGEPGGDGGDSEGTDAEKASVRTCTGDERFSFEEFVAGIEVVRQDFRDGAFVTEYASDSSVLPRVVVFNRPFRVPEEIASANGLEGDWFVPRGRYLMNAENRVRIPVQTG